MLCACMIGVMTATTSCINEDLSDCPVPADVANVELIYQVEPADDGDFLGGCTTSSLHLGFWDTPATLFAEQQLSGDDVPADLIYSVALPRKDYDHLAMLNCANVVDDTHTSMPQSIADVLLVQKTVSKDTVPAMTAPVYTGLAELPLSQLEAGSDVAYRVMLAPRVARMMLNVKHSDYLCNLRCYVEGSKQGYYPYTGQWIDDPALRVDATGTALINGEDETYFWFYTFPTSVNPRGKQAGDTGNDEPWTLHLYADYPDEDRTIKYTYTISQQARAGEVLRAIFVITDTTASSNIGAGVEIDIDWEPGLGYEVEM